MQLLANSASRAAVRPAGARRMVMAAPSRPALRYVVPRASSGGPGLDSEALQEKATELASQLKDKWEKTEDKPGAIVVISGTIIALSLAFSIVNAIDKIPVLSDLIELVGLGVTGWFTYRYLTVGPDRDELFVSIKGFIKKVYGQF